MCISAEWVDPPRRRSCYDSRLVVPGAGSNAVPLPPRSVDGHDFIPPALEHGAAEPSLFSATDSR